MLQRALEEVLEALWICGEKKDHRLEALRDACEIEVDEALLATLESDGLIAHEGDLVLLTQEGKERAAGVIRRHRLAERLLLDVLGMSLHEAERGACEFEHILAPQVAESICTLLGHPAECPHGERIPEGPCCRAAQDVIENVVVPLNRLEVGESGKIAYISTSNHSRLHKLMSSGLAPGEVLRVHQRSPSFVISCEQTEIALEEAVAAGIHVWRGGSE